MHAVDGLLSGLVQVLCRTSARNLAPTLIVLVTCLALSQPTPVWADGPVAEDMVDLYGGQHGVDPKAPADLSDYGVFYDRYEPTFYTGFAPRALDPKRLHLHVGRGNQLRVTLVLSDQVLDGYAADLLARWRQYRELIDDGKVVLTQNRALEAFDQRLRQLDLERRVESERDLPAAERRRSNLALMQQLNPGRVFAIRFAEPELVKRWTAQLQKKDGQSMNKQRRLELVNQLLPTRLWVTDLDRATGDQLERLARLGLEGQLARDSEPFFALLDRVSGGIYPRRDGYLDFDEFTAIYPVGSLNQYTQYRGHRIPLYPTPGKWLLTNHQRTKTVDHIPTVPVYSYSPWIPYMHVGKKLHNSFHTLWWRMEPERTSWLPAALKQTERRNRDGESYKRLWLLSRGPMSHGCTHVNAGHIMELRQLLPAEAEGMYQVAFYLNRSYLFDVFDIDGDFGPEVMGVEYFVAFSLRNKRPDKLRAPIDRRAFYDWLYGGELRYDDQGNGYFVDIQDALFIGKRAVKGTRYERLPLYEAAYQPEKLQFYKLVDIQFARELRKAGNHQTL